MSKQMDYDWQDTWMSELEELTEYLRDKRDKVWQVEEDVREVFHSIRDDYDNGEEISSADETLLEIYSKEASRLAELEEVESRLESAERKMEMLPDRAVEKRKKAVGGHRRDSVDEKRSEMEDLYREAVTYHNQLMDSLDEVILPTVEMANRLS